MNVLVACKTVLRLVFVLLNCIYCVPTYAVWMLVLLPLKHYHPDLYWRIEGTFFHWMCAMVTMWSWSAGYDIVEVGDDIRPCCAERTLVIANHQSTADAPMLFAAFNPRPNILPNIMWIMDHIFKYTTFGFISIFHQDFFILAGIEHRDVTVSLLKQHIRDSYIPLNRKFMVLFPEGGFLRKRREKSQKYALKNNLPVLNHVSLPRLGAMQGIIDVCGCKSDNTVKDDQLQWVLDVTIAYPDGNPLDLPTLVIGRREPCQTFMFYRLFPGSQIPTESEGMTKWLFARWEEKDRILTEYYSTGRMPVSQYCAAPAPPQTILQDPLRFFLLHFFFIMSSYIHYRLITFLLTALC